VQPAAQRGEHAGHARRRSRRRSADGRICGRSARLWTAQRRTVGAGRQADAATFDDPAPEPVDPPEEDPEEDDEEEDEDDDPLEESLDEDDGEDDDGEAANVSDLPLPERLSVR
jgi:hypothetical protein